MNKRISTKKKKWVNTSIFCSVVAALLIVGGLYLKKTESKQQPKKIEASTVVTAGDFRLTADNRWDNGDKKNYAELHWDDVADLTQSGYKLYQSADNGTSWDNRSLMYRKSIRVLNVYPDVDPIIGTANTLQDWMDQITAGTDVENLIQVIPVSITDFNADPDRYLENVAGEYQYDVIMFGTWDNNNHMDISENAAAASVNFIDSGRGVLLGHDTIYRRLTIINWYDYFSDYLGIGHDDEMENEFGFISGDYLSGSDKVRILNNGYLMQYPFKLPENGILDIPYSHSTELSDKNIGTVWAEFEDVGQNPGIYEDDKWRGGWYLKTNNNVAMIQTGHSNGDSSDDERKIIANVLYNLAQVSLENDAIDDTVSDDHAPDAPEAIIRCGNEDTINIKVDAKDNGTEHQFKVEANTRTGLLTSDIVEETITSNIAGYFYEVTDSPNTTLADTVGNLKDANGRIDPSHYNLYVAPDDDSVKYETATTFSLSEENTSDNYLHVLAVDRANNISAVSSQQIKDMTQLVDFEIERTANEAKIVELELDNSIENKMKSIEIQIPKHTEIKDFDSLTLPTDWYSFENSETTDYYSFSFAMEDNNSAATIQDFLEDLRFTINDPVNNSGSIKIIFHERVYTSWIDENGTTHYYVFMPEMSTPGKNWFQAYNCAKKLKYKGLTGYLATITSEDEHDFIYANIAKEPGWLGGTRAVLQSGDQINDESEVLLRTEDYDLDQDSWYWVNGPDTGEIFYEGKRKSEGGYTPNGAFSIFNESEPNNNNGEYALQFDKWWNDLPGDWGYDFYNMRGYYVEFSEYGSQVEGEEVTDVCWNAAIPQKISLQGYVERFGQTQRFDRGDILYDQNLRIGQEKTVTPKEFELYRFLELRDREGDMVLGPLVDEQYTVTNQFQEGAIIYEKSHVKLNVRQVVLDGDDQLVQPTEGYLNLKTLLYDQDTLTNTEDPSQLMQTSMPSQLTEDVPTFETFFVSTKHMTDERDQLKLELILPDFYEYVNHYLTYAIIDPNGAEHQNKSESDLYANETVYHRIVLEDDEEYFITFYIQPTTAGQSPQPYSWDYKLNDLGEIKTK